MDAYRTRARKLSGSDYSEVGPQARLLFREVEKRSRRRPYIRSAYFGKEKVFLEYFWPHMLEKSLPDRTRRARFIACGFELIACSRHAPTGKVNPNRKDELLHRFLGESAEGEAFAVQIKEDRKTGQKFLLSIFPVE